MRANAEKISRLLKTARGQLDGIQKMVEKDAYCMDISNQLLACQAVIKRANAEVIKCHMESCVKNAFEGGDQSSSEKHILELMQLFDKLSK